MYITITSFSLLHFFSILISGTVRTLHRQPSHCLICTVFRIYSSIMYGGHDARVYSVLLVSLSPSLSLCLCVCVCEHLEP